MVGKSWTLSVCLQSERGDFGRGEKSCSGGANVPKARRLRTQGTKLIIFEVYFYRKLSKFYCYRNPLHIETGTTCRSRPLPHVRTNASLPSGCRGLLPTKHRERAHKAAVAMLGHPARAAEILLRVEVARAVVDCCHTGRAVSRPAIADELNLFRLARL